MIQQHQVLGIHPHSSLLICYTQYVASISWPKMVVSPPAKIYLGMGNGKTVYLFFLRACHRSCSYHFLFWQKCSRMSRPAREARKYSPRLYGKVLSQNLGVVILKEEEERTLRDSSNFCHSRLGYLPALQVNHKFNG